MIFMRHKVSDSVSASGDADNICISRSFCFMEVILFIMNG